MPEEDVLNKMKEKVSQIKEDEKPNNPEPQEPSQGEGNEPTQHKWKITQTSESDEDRARQHGWRPKEEWKGDESEWVSAKEFNNRASFFDKISSQGKEVAALKKQLQSKDDEITKRIENVAKVVREQTLRELEAKKNIAIQEADVEAANQHQEQIDKLKEEIPDVKIEEPPETQEPQIAPFVQKWIDQRPWFGQDLTLTNFATAYEQSYIKNNYSDGNISESEYLKVLDAVEKATVRAFPDMFEQPTKSQTPSVESGRPSRQGSFNISNFSKEEAQISNAFEKMGMSKEDYKQALKDLGSVEDRVSVKKPKYKNSF